MTDAANRTIVLAPGVDWNTTDGAAADQLEVRLTEPAAPSPGSGYAIAIENTSSTDVAVPLVVEIEVPRIDGLELPADDAWACDVLDDDAVRCSHPGGLAGASTSVLEFASAAVAERGDDPAVSEDPTIEETAAGATESVLRSEGGSPATDTALAVAALALTGFVVFGSRRLLTKRK